MLLNYIKIALRVLIRQRGYSLINISGLAIGIASFILISMWIVNESSYDQFHEKKERIFRVNTMTDKYGLATTSSWRLGQALVEKYPDIVQYTRFWPWNRSLVKYEDKVFDEIQLSLADPSFFTIFSFPFIYGNPEYALKDKNSVVLTEEIAQIYFGDTNPIGKLLFVQLYEKVFKVTGVIRNIPTTSSIQFDIIARVDLMPQQRLDSWEFTGYTFVLLHETANPETVNKKIVSFYRDHVIADSKYYPLLQPLSKIHLYERGTAGLIKQIYLFSTVAILILLIACINFMNLSTARASKRTIEVGVRKVLGAYRKQLIHQFIEESVLTAFISLFLGLLLIEIVLPHFNSIANTKLNLFSEEILKKILLLSAITFLAGLFAGSYPALYLSSFNPIKVLKGSGLIKGRGKMFRKVLIVFQFTISIALIICTMIIHEQLNFIKSKDLGLKRDLIITLRNNLSLNNQYESYKNQLLEGARVENVTASASNPFDIGQWIDVNWEGHIEQEEIPMQYTMVDYDYFQTFAMNFIEGRPFSKEFSSDASEACIINQTAVNMMGLAFPIGAELYFNHPAFEESFKKVKIIGVVDDFHYRPLHKKIGPFIFRMYKPWHAYIYIKIKPGDLRASLKHIEHITKKFAPEYPFRYEFLNDRYDKIYSSEIRMGKVFNLFAILAILISCLGLFGLASYSIEQRTKEIGIRKVLGASIAVIVTMLSREFTKWIIVANLFAWPVAGYFMYKWLDNFAYRVSLSWWTFIAASALVLAIALFTISYQAYKSARSNPVEALRYE